MRRALLLGAACAAFVGCAQVGPVQPPSAHLPRPVADFTAVRHGPVIRLAWTPPTTTSDGVTWSGSVGYHLCVWPGVQRGRKSPPAPPSNVAPAQVPSPRSANIGADETPSGAAMPPCPHLLVLSAPQVSVDALALPSSVGFATVALFAVNGQGEGAGWSNPVVVPLTPVAPPPAQLNAAATSDGVALHWQPPAPPLPAVHVYRNGVLLTSLPGTAAGYLDRTAGWNQHYQYFLRSAAGEGQAAVESAASPVVSVFTTAVAPPAPTGLEVVVAPAGGGVDLSWNPVSAADLRGYNVYRQLPGSAVWERRNSTSVLTPVFHDAAAPGGARYAVTAVSTSGAQSPRSASVVLPPEL